MQLKFNKVIAQEEIVSVDPGCYKYGRTYFKVNNGKALMVTERTDYNSGELKTLSPETDASMLGLILKSESISEDEFMKVYCDLHNEMAAIIQPKLLKTA